MIDHNTLSSERSGSSSARRDFVVRGPVRLYESRGTIFELYDGGQPYQPMAIRWEHLESIEGMDTQTPQFPPQAGGEAMNNIEPIIEQNHVQLFALGQIVATPGALVALEVSHQSPAEFLRRHARGDWVT